MDPGFPDIEHLLIQHFYEINHRAKETIADYTINTIACMGEMFSENTPHGDEMFTPQDIRYRVITVTNRFVDSSGHSIPYFEIHYHLSTLEKIAEDIKIPNILRFCFGAFFIGCILEGLGFYFEHQETIKELNIVERQHGGATPAIIETASSEQKPSTVDLPKEGPQVCGDVSQLTKPPSTDSERKHQPTQNSP